MTPATSSASPATELKADIPSAPPRSSDLSERQQAVRGLLIRGMLVGLAAGLLMFVFAKIFGEPRGRQGDRVRGGAQPAARARRRWSAAALQSTLGLLTGTVVYGVAMGGVFALVFAAVHGRIGHARPRITAGTLAIVAFAVIILVPFLKYPSNPPAVGNDDTIGYRTQIYFAMMAISVGAAVAALRVGKDTVKRFGALERHARRSRRLHRPGAPSAMLLMPGLNEIPQRLRPGRHLGLPRRHARHPRRALHDARARLRRPRGALAQRPRRRSRYVSNIQPFRRRASLLTRTISSRTSRQHARHEQLVGRAEVRAPVDLDRRIDVHERQAGVEHDDDVVGASCPPRPAAART